MTRFRADYQRQITEQDADTVHTLTYPTSGELFPGSGLLGGFALQVPTAVGTVKEHPDGSAHAYTTDGERLDSNQGPYRNADTAIKALIEHDQSLHNQ